MTKLTLSDWKLAYAPHSICKGKALCTPEDIEKTGYDIIKASVPGNFELDLMREGKLPELFYGTNVFMAQKLENMHLWYYTVFKWSGGKARLTFEGIDTVADIYVNGILQKHCENMFIPHTAEPELVCGENSIVVHIIPAMIASRGKALSSQTSVMQTQNLAAIGLRKSSHMFGWDIMPRIVSAGLWRPVTVEPTGGDSISQVHIGTVSISPNGDSATLRLFVQGDIDGDCITDYTVRVVGHCGESSFESSAVMWHSSAVIGNIKVEEPKLWYPINYGEPNLYKTKVELIYKGNVVDTVSLRIGIRTVSLSRSEYTKDGQGDFSFIINGKRVFALGTNWVPTDPFPSRREERQKELLSMLDDLGCNMLRLWGGNAYESDSLYDYCDEHGIMIWQDFAMACAVYPQDREYCDSLYEEAVYQVKRLRNHPSMTLWSGDNECDLAALWSSLGRRDPGENILTRKILSDAVNLHNAEIPYLPSSPYYSPSVTDGKGEPPEQHLWGPRDYFKGKYYKDTFCHFVSEIGYHGFNSVKSLEKFLCEPKKIFEEDGTPTSEYLAHSVCVEAKKNAQGAYRIPLAYNQVLVLFGKAENELPDFVRQSQISQAEADKYFIEKFRIDHTRRHGILWWNLSDGWPQVSDAVVDYYGVKKLAYHYIKRSQSPVCLMFDEPKGDSITLYGVNDTQKDVRIWYSVFDITADKCVMSSDTVLPANTAEALLPHRIEKDEKHFYLIRWSGDACGFNHYHTNIADIDYHAYLDCMKKCNMYQFDE